MFERGMLGTPVAGNMGVVAPAPGFLAGLRELTQRHDCRAPDRGPEVVVVTAMAGDLPRERRRDT